MQLPSVSPVLNKRNRRVAVGWVLQPLLYADMEVGFFAVAVLCDYGGNFFVLGGITQ